MRMPFSRRDFLKLGVFGTASVGTTGCGSIFFPERIGQPHRGALDWKVVALDTVGLLFFLVPGVIAFVVDFVNGTIYLPPGQCAHELETWGTGRFTTIEVAPEELDRAKIEQVVSKHTERDVRLADGTYRTRMLSTLDEFWKAREAMSSSAND